MFCVGVLLCFRQRTAYEIRISDWSSDVCSSDLRAEGGRAAGHPGAALSLLRQGHGQPWVRHPRRDHGLPERGFRSAGDPGRHRGGGLRGALRGRSEEHTSELQSLMRISYAVFCLKKKNTKENVEL